MHGLARNLYEPREEATRFIWMSLHAPEGSGLYVEPDLRYQYFFEYLRLSPSYRLVHRQMTGQESDLTLPADRAEVIKTYEMFGSVEETPCHRWWSKGAYKPFAIKEFDRNVRVVSRLNATRSKDELIEDVLKFHDGAWTANGKLETLVVAIPLTTWRAHLLYQLNQLLLHDPLPLNATDQEPAFKLLHHSATHVTLQSLVKGRKFLKAVITHRSDARWQSALRAKLGPKDYRYLNPDIPSNDPDDREPKRVLGIIGSRWYRNALLIAENAARRRFPTDAFFPEALNMKLKPFSIARSV